MALNPDIKILEKWAALCQDYGARPWFCRQVRKVPVILEEETLEAGYPEVKVDSAKEYGCGIVYSRKLKNKYGEKNLAYYQKFKKCVLKAHKSGMHPQIIFDDLRPEHITYDTIYAPMHAELDGEMKQYISDFKCVISDL